MSPGILVITIGFVLLMIIVIIIHSVVFVVLLLLISVRSRRVRICRRQCLVGLKNNVRRSTKGHRGRMSISLLDAECVVAPVEIVASASKSKKRGTTWFWPLSNCEHEKRSAAQRRKKARKHTRADFHVENQQETIKKEAEREINKKRSYLRVDCATRTQRRKEAFVGRFRIFSSEHQTQKNRCIKK